jgi:hypothetical protein
MPYQVQVWDRQELFLAAYARTGKRSKAAKEAGLLCGVLRNGLLLMFTASGKGWSRPNTYM